MCTASRWLRWRWLRAGLGRVLLTGLLAVSACTSTSPLPARSELIPAAIRFLTPPLCLGAVDDAEVSACVERSLTDVWAEEFGRVDRSYSPPGLVVPDTTTQAGPRAAYLRARAYYDAGVIHVSASYLRAVRTAVGPDRMVDAIGFTLAHETGHRVQDLLGLYRRPAFNSTDASVRIEEQADCFGGVWAHQEVNAGRLDRATAAATVGTLLRLLSTDSFGHTIDPRMEVRSHGTARQRMGWFDRGLDSGQPGACTTFAGTPYGVHLPWPAPTPSVSGPG